MSWTKEQCKEYMKAYRQAHKEQAKAWYKANKEEMKAKKKEWYEANKEDLKAYQKAYYQATKEQRKTYNQAHKEQKKLYTINYMKNDVNSFGETKNSIRLKSRYILKKSGIKISDYEIHHCFTYDDPSKFIYCSKELHLKIHQFLRDNNIDADSDHYEQIKHLLDEKVVTFGL